MHLLQQRKVHDELLPYSDWMHSGRTGSHLRKYPSLSSRSLHSAAISSVTCRRREQPPPLHPRLPISFGTCLTLVCCISYLLMPYQCMKMKSTLLLYSSSSLLPALASAAITLRSNNRRRVVGWGRSSQTVRCGLETRVGVVTTTNGSCGGEGGGGRQRRAFVSRGAAAGGRSGNGGVTPPQQQRFQGMGLWFKDGYELTDPSSVDKNHSQVDMTDTDAPVLHRLKDGFIRFKENKFL